MTVNLDLEHHLDTDHTYERGHDQLSANHQNDDEYAYNQPYPEEQNPYSNLSDHDVNNKLDSFAHDNYVSYNDNLANDLSCNSDTESNTISYHEHSGTVYHEHYWEKPKPYMGESADSETMYDSNNTTYGDTPEPVGNNCIDNNENGICDSAESSDNGGSSDND